MASAISSRFLVRNTLRSAPARSSICSPLIRVPALRQQGRSSYRQYSFSAKEASGSTYNSSIKPLLLGIGVGTIGGAAFYLYATDQLPLGDKNVIPVNPGKDDFQKVYNEIARLFVEKDDYDDGSYGPVVLRLAWHCSESKTGGSNGATMRFSPESGHSANNGLLVAREFLEPVKQKFPWISYSDLWTLAGVCAIQELGGPQIQWRPGRNDALAEACTPDGRLPDATKGGRHLRDIFYRMGFNDQEIVALAGAHALGRCHTDRSGFDGPWTFSPTMMTNDFYKLLLSEKWQWKKWNGPAQYEDKSTKSLMMLPTDFALVTDKEFKKHVERYAKDQEVFFNEFSKAIEKLFELGVPFKQEEKYVFNPTS